MKANLRGFGAAVCFCTLFVVAMGVAALGQSNPAQRTFLAPEAKVQQALQTLHSTESGRLPTLDGFVDTTEPLDHYERGFYQCEVQENAAAGGGTTVRVTAKITAWYTDPAGTHSGYRVLASNGRIESDFLDSLGDALGAKSTASSSAPAHSGGSAHPPASAPSASSNGAAGVGKASTNAAAPSKANAPAPPTTTAAGATPPPADGAPAADLTEMSVEGIEARRQETERKIQSLITETQNLEQIKQSRSEPNDIACVKKAGVKIYANPNADAEVLMTADAKDEFPILDMQGGWVHVEISGPSRGWIRRADLDVPSGAPGEPASAGANSNAAPLFRVSREDMTPFAGTWGPLKDKVVKIIWVSPADSAPAQTAAQAKRDYAKSLFLKAYREISNDPAPVAGVVVIFDSADGGQIAATTASVKLLNNGNISDDQFWGQCSLDPPEAFQDADPQ